jgi:hypothetical protein
MMIAEMDFQSAFGNGKPHGCTKRMKICGIGKNPTPLGNVREKDFGYSAMEWCCNMCGHNTHGMLGDDPLVV